MSDESEARCGECGHLESEHFADPWGLGGCHHLVEMSHTMADGEHVAWDQKCDCDAYVLAPAEEGAP